MKRTLLISALILCALSAAAQNIAIGERVPDLKAVSWLKNNTPISASFTYIEFFHSSNPSCINSLNQLKNTAEQLNGKLRILIITQEKEEKVAQMLAPYISERIGVGIDASGKTFSGFGVTYIPFGVLTDAKNRALWMGNSLQLTPAFIEKITK